ncbi:hypothetical protein D3C76_973590 [compost metagenome]
MGRDHRAERDLHRVQGHATAGGGALAESVPTVDHRQTGIVTLDEGDERLVLFVDRHRRHDVRKQRAGAVELLAVDLRGVVVEVNTGFKSPGVFAFRFREGVAEAVTLQHFAEVVLLLLFAGGLHQDVEHAKVVLRDLAQGRISGGNDLDHFGDGHIRHSGATVGFWHGDAPEAASGELVELGNRQTSFAIAHAGFDGESRRELVGDGNRFRIRADHMGRAHTGRAGGLG